MTQYITLEENIKHLRDEEAKFRRYALIARTNVFEPEVNRKYSEQANTNVANGLRRQADWLEELQYYKNLEEQGQMVMLPCKVGDTVYCCDFGRVTAYKITGYSYGTAEDYIDEPVSCNQIVFYYCGFGSVVGSSVTGSFAASILGKTVFVTYEEAEAELEKRCE